MKRPGSHTGNPQSAQAGSHFASGFRREGEGENLVGLVLALLNAVGNAVGQCSGFSRTRAGENTQRAPPRGRHNALVFIQTLKSLWVRHAQAISRLSHASIMERAMEGGPGRITPESEERSSSLVNQRRSTISVPSGRKSFACAGSSWA